MFARLNKSATLNNVATLGTTALSIYGSYTNYNLSRTQNENTDALYNLSFAMGILTAGYLFVSQLPARYKTDGITVPQGGYFVSENYSYTAGRMLQLGGTALSGAALYFLGAQVLPTVTALALTAAITTASGNFLVGGYAPRGAYEEIESEEAESTWTQIKKSLTTTNLLAVLTAGTAVAGAYYDNKLSKTDPDNSDALYKTSRILGIGTAALLYSVQFVQFCRTVFFHRPVGMNQENTPDCGTCCTQSLNYLLTNSIYVLGRFLQVAGFALGGKGIHSDGAKNPQEGTALILGGALALGIGTFFVNSVRPKNPQAAQGLQNDGDPASAPPAYGHNQLGNGV